MKQVVDPGLLPRQDPRHPEAQEVVGLVQDAGDATWSARQLGLDRLAGEGAIRGWYEATDRGALRGSLERTLCVIEPEALARDGRLGHWACLDAWDDAIDGVATFLRAHRAVAGPLAVNRQLCHLAEHRARLQATASRTGLARSQIARAS